MTVRFEVQRGVVMPARESDAAAEIIGMTVNAPKAVAFAQLVKEFVGVNVLVTVPAPTMDLKAMDARVCLHAEQTSAKIALDLSMRRRCAFEKHSERNGNEGDEKRANLPAPVRQCNQ